MALCLLLAGCGGAVPAEEISQPGQISFTDSTGAEVTLFDCPEKVAVLFSSYAQIWQLAGGEVAVTVGESVERGFAPEGTALVDSGAGKSIDRELLLAEKPDLIIGSADIAAQAEVCQEMAKLGIPSALFRVDDFSQYLSMLKICTQITGCAQAYETHGTAVSKEIDAILAAAENTGLPKKKILFIRAGSSYSATKAKRAPDNFVCTMLDQLGAQNIADEAAVLLDSLSLEEILLQDPDYIFITTMGSEEAAKGYVQTLFAEEGWKDLSAVKAGNYTFLAKELFHFKPNHRWAEAYRQLFDLLYPELKNDEA